MHPIINALYDLRNEPQRAILMRFFKTGPGQYGEGDQFLGIKIPEVRLCGFLILTYKMEYLCRKRVVNTLESMQARDAIVRLYLQYADRANNWDLVDLSAPKIIGPWLLLPTELGDKHAIMDSLAHSPVLWRQRIAMVSTWKTTQQGDPTWALHYAEVLLHHPHDLMHKAVGWMLREVGKRCGKEYLNDFLEQHVHNMPRTALRYAIELLPEYERQEWLRR